MKKKTILQGGEKAIYTCEKAVYTCKAIKIKSDGEGVLESSMEYDQMCPIEKSKSPIFPLSEYMKGGGRMKKSDDHRHCQNQK